MATNRSQQFSAPNPSTHRFFNIFGKLRLMSVAGLLLLPQLLAAQWNATVGAESSDLGRQGLAFLPNEIWIHTGDSITWTMATAEPHTVTFLTDRQVRPPFNVGCPGFSSGSAVFDGSSCVTSALLSKGTRLTVTFPAIGNFKLVCLVHNDMTGMVHVLDASQPLPHDQEFYDRLAQTQARTLLAERDATESKHIHPKNDVTVGGGGEVVATGAGTDTLSVLRFSDPVVTVHAGDTVEWTNEDSVTPHTVTFGTEPQDPAAPSSNVTVDPDGALHGVLNSTSDSVHSGFLMAAPQDRVGLAQASPGATRFRVTFSKPGVYPYICALHDGLGMKGQVVVLPSQVARQPSGRRIPEIWTHWRKFGHKPVLAGTENGFQGGQMKRETERSTELANSPLHEKNDPTSTNREFVKRHFEAVNRREIPTVRGNMRPDLYDHELEGDHTNDLAEGAQRLQVLMKQVPDLMVDVRDVIADGDKVVVRAVWSGTNVVSQRKVEFHGFVQWRIVDGKFAERWATVTPMAEIPEGTKVW